VTDAAALRIRVRALLNAPVDAASLRAFRALFGLVMAAALVRTLARGWVGQLYVAPAFHFTWDGFGWVRPWPGAGMYVHVVALVLLALGLALGVRPRLCALLFALGFTYLELCDQALYLNHYYLVSLLAGLLALLPVGRAATVPAWVLGVLRFQVAVVYAYAGVAKLNADWLLAAQPLRLWLSARADLPLIGPALALPATAYAASWAGAAYDLAIVPLLLARRTRPLAVALVVAFHLATWLLFPIGVFPWVMLAASTLFLDPGWTRRWWRPRVTDGPRPAPRWTMAAAFVHCALQALLPLRAWPGASGPAAWTGAGFNFSWRVMVAEKAGQVEFRARDPVDGRVTRVAAARYVTPLQEAMMAQDPAMIRALARHIAGRLAADAGHAVEVRVDAFASLNGRPSQRLIDPAVDLARATPRGWIVPLAP